jgi:putative colanic acid biosynthesis glycosyltransferase
MSAPLFSIVTVTLNCAEDACRTARSVLEQDFGDFEYIVKDGESSDDTVVRLRELGVSKLHVCKDAGIYPAMNQALALCTGRYVWYLNAGDILASPTVLSQFAGSIEQHSFPAFVYGDMQSLEPHPFWRDSDTGRPRQVRMRGRLSRFYLYRRTICHQAWAVERSLYQRCGGLDERIRFVADYDFLLKVILRLHVSYLRIPCVSITYAAGGDAARNDDQVQLMTQQLLRRHFPPWERCTYEVLSQVARLVVHGRWFSRLHRHLPPNWRAVLAGL